MRNIAPVDSSVRDTADVAIIGHGLAGCIAARVLLDAGARVILVDAGSPLTVIPGAHLLNLPACQGDRSFYTELVRANLRPASVPLPARRPFSDSVPPMPNGNGVNAGQRAHVNMPAASLTYHLGGMGTLWNCVAPRFDPGSELWPGISVAEWSELYERAEGFMAVKPWEGGGSGRQWSIVKALSAAGRAGARPAPVAARREARAVRWTGPAEILGDLGSRARQNLTVLPQTAVRRLRHRGGRVFAADAVALGGPGTRARVQADVFIVAAGAIMTPALLWASGIFRADGDGSPLGRYLCDHPLASAQLVLRPDFLPHQPGSPDPDPIVIVVPAAGHPFHSLVLCDSYDGRTLEGQVDERLVISLYWYTTMTPRFENRVAFAAKAAGRAMHPQPTFEYALSRDELDRQEAAVQDLRTIGPLLGTFLPGRRPQKASPGASMHIMGTTRMGNADDGRSVVDAHGRVWGFGNLYLAGTGLIPSATATNPALTACALAIRTAESICSPRTAPRAHRATGSAAPQETA